jgi:hypothetical protein
MATTVIGARKNAKKKRDGRPISRLALRAVVLMALIRNQVEVVWPEAHVKTGSLYDLRR